MASCLGYENFSLNYRFFEFYYAYSLVYFVFILIFRFDPHSEIYFYNIFHIFTDYMRWFIFCRTLFWFPFNFVNFIRILLFTYQLLFLKCSPNPWWSTDPMKIISQCVFRMPTPAHPKGQTVQIVQYADNQPTTSLKRVNDVNAFIDNISLSSNRYVL